ncbi:MAG: DNA polymerase subunit beta [Methanosarcinales archaeon]|jgi:predicted nucleotidyltransferase|nr:DNA polymerase subunit beta [Methanosarcinales archaeon]
MANPNSNKFEDPTLRDFFVTKDGLIFSVPDYFHPASGIRAILRYIPDAGGTRTWRMTGKKYRKAGFDESFDYLKKFHPDWVFDVAVVPRDEIAEILKPNDAVKDLLSGKQTHPAALELVRRFMDAGISADLTGITGSILAGLDNEDSDIDFLVYGDEWTAARQKLKAMKADDRGQNKPFRIAELDEQMLRTVHRKRKSPLSFDDFFIHEIRKGNRGMFTCAENGGKNVYFDLLFVRSKDQSGAPIQRGADTEKIVIEAVVTNDDFSFDSPAVYSVSHDEISEIYSYTHTYAGQALTGEIIRARGIVEIVGDKKRLVIGTSREAEDEWMISLSLSEARDKQAVMTERDG